MNEFNSLLDRLQELGEDAAEMEFWRKIFGALTEEEQQSLIENVKKEIEELQKV